MYFLPFGLEKLKDWFNHQGCGSWGVLAAQSVCDLPTLWNWSCIFWLKHWKEKEHEQSNVCSLNPFLYKKKEYLKVEISLSLSLYLMAAILAHPQSILPRGPCATPSYAQWLFGALRMTFKQWPTVPSIGPQLKRPSSESPSLAIPPKAAGSLPQNPSLPAHHPTIFPPQRTHHCLKYSYLLSIASPPPSRM